MNHSTYSRVGLIAAGALIAATCGTAYAGGRGGGGGDSSMNPYTGDSYAYFHGGHNLGEGGTIRPGGTPPATGWQLWPWQGRAASAAPPATPSGQFQPAPDDRTARAPSDTQPSTAR